MSRDTTPILYHGMQLSKLNSLRTHGLSGDFAKVAPGFVHLSSDSGQAEGYFQNFGNGPGLLLSVQNLDTSLFGPDREDLADLLEQDDDERDWSDCTWMESLSICGQCTFHGSVPPNLITVEGYEHDGKFITIDMPLLSWIPTQDVLDVIMDSTTPGVGTP